MSQFPVDLILLCVSEAELYCLSQFRFSALLGSAGDFLNHMAGSIIKNSNGKSWGI